MNNAIADILKGLKALGVDGRVRIETLQYDRIKVFVNDKYFGLWDIKRKTFVD